MAGKKSKTIQQLLPKLQEHCGDQWESVTERAEAEFAALMAENSDQPKALVPHTRDEIFPAIAIHRALMAVGESREASAKFLYDAYAWRAQKGADQMKAMMRIPGLYKLMPAAWKVVTRTKFGAAAGFQFHFYDVGRHRVKFDMTRCPYCEICRKYDCPEIVPAFCHTDDINSEDLHPKLLWNRTKTMGGGDDVCDFDLIAKD